LIVAGASNPPARKLLTRNDFSVPHFPVGQAFNRKMGDRKMAASGGHFSSILRLTQERDGHPRNITGRIAGKYLNCARLVLIALLISLGPSPGIAEPAR
jgi:hypothetical protein